MQVCEPTLFWLAGSVSHLRIRSQYCLHLRAQVRYCPFQQSAVPRSRAPVPSTNGEQTFSTVLSSTIDEPRSRSGRCRRISRSTARPLPAPPVTGERSPPPSRRGFPVYATVRCSPVLTALVGTSYSESGPTLPAAPVPFSSTGERCAAWILYCQERCVSDRYWCGDPRPGTVQPGALLCNSSSSSEMDEARTGQLRLFIGEHPWRYSPRGCSEAGSGWHTWVSRAPVPSSRRALLLLPLIQVPFPTVPGN
ncbi:hypothetical protein NDU88_001785 [Pleurodeles waltl]|uniref:Uncharacterized protein n=1 Tax=Pleurodeles waltl TaxID=8319 RepID=A0AAV7Q5C0_PLEWA|nr:hypothetical protein NDU88_001785 [Pleurodeles waltl]